MPHPLELLTVVPRHVVAQELGCTPMTIYNIEKRAFAKIRKNFPEMALFLFPDPTHDPEPIEILEPLNIDA